MQSLGKVNMCRLRLSLSLASLLVLIVLQGCDPPRRCGDITTPVGSMSLQLEVFIRTKIVGSVTCAGSPQAGVIEFHPRESSCPEDNSRDMEGLVAEIHKMCINPISIWSASERLVPDWIGSHSVLLVPSVDQLDLSMSTSCRNGSVEVTLPSQGSLDLRATIGQKFVLLRPDLIKVEFSPDEWSPEIVALLQPVSEVLYQPSVALTQVTIEREKVERSIAVKTPNGKRLFIDLHAHKGAEAVLVLVVRKDEAVEFSVAEACKACLVENDARRPECLVEEMKDLCGTQSRECKQDIEIARFYCAKSCWT